MTTITGNKGSKMLGIAMLLALMLIAGACGTETEPNTAQSEAATTTEMVDPTPTEGAEPADIAFTVEQNTEYQDNPGCVSENPEEPCTGWFILQPDGIATLGLTGDILFRGEWSVEDGEVVLTPERESGLAEHRFGVEADGNLRDAESGTLWTALG